MVIPPTTTSTNYDDEAVVTYNAKSKLHLILEGIDMVDVGGWFGSTDPFYVIQSPVPTSTGSVVWQTVYQSEEIPNCLNPRWKKAVLDLRALCPGKQRRRQGGGAEGKDDNDDNVDIHKPIRIKVVDWEPSEKHNNMGYFDTSVADLLEASGDASKTAPLRDYDNGNNGEEEYGKLVVRLARIKTPRPDLVLARRKFQNSRRRQRSSTCSDNPLPNATATNGDDDSGKSDDVMMDKTTLWYLTLQAKDLSDVSPWFGTLDPYFQIATAGGEHPKDGSRIWQTVCRSEHVIDSFNPIWKEAAVSLYLLCGGEENLDKPFRVSVFDNIDGGKPTPMGFFDTSVKDMMKASKDETIDFTLQDEKGTKYGTIHVMHAQLPGDYSDSSMGSLFDNSNKHLSVPETQLETINPKAMAVDQTPDDIRGRRSSTSFKGDEESRQSRRSSRSSSKRKDDDESRVSRHSRSSRKSEDSKRSRCSAKSRDDGYHRSPKKHSISSSRQENERHGTSSRDSLSKYHQSVKGVRRTLSAAQHSTAQRQLNHQTRQLRPKDESDERTHPMLPPGSLAEAEMKGEAPGEKDAMQTAAEAIIQPKEEEEKAAADFDAREAEADLSNLIVRPTQVLEVTESINVPGPHAIPTTDAEASVAQSEGTTQPSCSQNLHVFGNSIVSRPDQDRVSESNNVSPQSENTTQFMTHPVDLHITTVEPHETLGTNQIESVLTAESGKIAPQTSTLHVQQTLDVSQASLQPGAIPDAEKPARQSEVNMQTPAPPELQLPSSIIFPQTEVAVDAPIQTGEQMQEEKDNIPLLQKSPQAQPIVSMHSTVVTRPFEKIQEPLSESQLLEEASKYWQILQDQKATEKVDGADVWHIEIANETLALDIESKVRNDTSPHKVRAASPSNPSHVDRVRSPLQERAIFPRGHEKELPLEQPLVAATLPSSQSEQEMSNKTLQTLPMNTIVNSESTPLQTNVTITHDVGEFVEHEEFRIAKPAVADIEELSHPEFYLTQTTSQSGGDQTLGFMEDDVPAATDPFNVSKDYVEWHQLQSRDSGPSSSDEDEEKIEQKPDAGQRKTQIETGDKSLGDNDDARSLLDLDSGSDESDSDFDMELSCLFDSRPATSMKTDDEPREGSTIHFLGSPINEMTSGRHASFFNMNASYNDFSLAAEAGEDRRSSTSAEQLLEMEHLKDQHPVINGNGVFHPGVDQLSSDASKSDLGADTDSVLVNVDNEGFAQISVDSGTSASLSEGRQLPSDGGNDEALSRLQLKKETRDERVMDSDIVAAFKENQDSAASSEERVHSSSILGPSPLDETLLTGEVQQEATHSNQKAAVVPMKMIGDGSAVVNILTSVENAQPTPLEVTDDLKISSEPEERLCEKHLSHEEIACIVNTEGGQSVKLQEAKNEASGEATPMSFAAEGILFDEKINLTIGGRDLENMGGWFGSTTAFFEISCWIPGRSAIWNNVYRSEQITDNLCPDWEAIELDLASFCHGDLGTQIRLCVFDWKEKEQHVPMGSAEISLKDALKASRATPISLQLVSHEKNYGKLVIIDAYLKNVRMDAQLQCPSLQNEKSSAHVAPPEEQKLSSSQSSQSENATSTSPIDETMIRESTMVKDLSPKETMSSSSVGKAKNTTKIDLKSIEDAAQIAVKGRLSITPLDAEEASMLPKKVQSEKNNQDFLPASVGQASTSEVTANNGAVTVLKQANVEAQDTTIEMKDILRFDLTKNEGDQELQNVVSKLPPAGDDALTVSGDGQRLLNQAALLKKTILEKDMLLSYSKSLAQQVTSLEENLLQRDKLLEDTNKRIVCLLSEKKSLEVEVSVHVKLFRDLTDTKQRLEESLVDTKATILSYQRDLDRALEKMATMEVDYAKMQNRITRENSGPGGTDQEGFLEEIETAVADNAAVTAATAEEAAGVNASIQRESEDTIAVLTAEKSTLSQTVATLEQRLETIQREAHERVLADTRLLENSQTRSSTLDRKTLEAALAEAELKVQSYASTMVAEEAKMRLANEEKRELTKKADKIKRVAAKNKETVKQAKILLAKYKAGRKKHSKEMASLKKSLKHSQRKLIKLEKSVASRDKLLEKTKETIEGLKAEKATLESKVSPGKETGEAAAQTNSGVVNEFSGNQDNLLSKVKELETNLEQANKQREAAVKAKKLYEGFWKDAKESLIEQVKKAAPESKSGPFKTIPDGSFGKIETSDNNEVMQTSWDAFSKPDATPLFELEREGSGKIKGQRKSRRRSTRMPQKHGDSKSSTGMKRRSKRSSSRSIPSSLTTTARLRSSTEKSRSSFQSRPSAIAHAQLKGLVPVGVEVSQMTSSRLRRGFYRVERKKSKQNNEAREEEKPVTIARADDPATQNGLAVSKGASADTIISADEPTNILEPTISTIVEIDEENEESTDGAEEVETITKTPKMSKSKTSWFGSRKYQKKESQENQDLSTREDDENTGTGVDLSDNVSVTRTEQISSIPKTPKTPSRKIFSFGRSKQKEQVEIDDEDFDLVDTGMGLMDENSRAGDAPNTPQTQKKHLKKKMPSTPVSVSSKSPKSPKKGLFSFFGRKDSTEAAEDIDEECTQETPAAQSDAVLAVRILQEKEAQRLRRSGNGRPRHSSNSAGTHRPKRRPRPAKADLGLDAKSTATRRASRRSQAPKPKKGEIAERRARRSKILKNRPGVEETTNSDLEKQSNHSKCSSLSAPDTNVGHRYKSILKTSVTSGNVSKDADKNARLERIHRVRISSEDSDMEVVESLLGDEEERADE